MARGAVSGEAVVCASCGAKFKAKHARCPRCRAFAPAAPSPSDPRAAPSTGRAGVIVFVAFGVALAGLWLYDREPAPAPRTTVGPVRDPLAARRPPAAADPAKADVAVPPDPAFRLSPGLPDDSEEGDAAARLERSRLQLARDPLNADALYETGLQLIRLDRAEEALAPLRQAAEMHPDRWPQAFTFAYACALRQRWPEAVAGFRRARVLGPEDSVTSYDLALAHQKLADYDGAAREYAAAIALDPSNASPRLGLAISLDRQGKSAEARTAYGDALRLMPPGPDAERIRARVSRLEG